MIVIDGSFGEGGGQILRSSLCLSMITGKAFRIEKIRAGRKKPGLLRQHLTAVKAAAAVCGAEIEGAEAGSMKLSFKPGKVKAGAYEFAVGTAGSGTLVAQTILPALALLGENSELKISGGTHNPFAPPYDFLEKVYLPLLAKAGCGIESRLEKYGFYPAGGGAFSISVKPSGKLKHLELMERGEVKSRKIRAVSAQLPHEIGKNELESASAQLGWEDSCTSLESVASCGPGNILMIELESEHISELFTGFGEQGRSWQKVVSDAVRQTRQYLAAAVPVGTYLADQLMLLMAVGEGGSFRTLELSMHARTNVKVIKSFLELDIKVTAKENKTVEVRIQ